GLVGEEAAVGEARVRPLAHQFERSLGDPDGAHAVVDASRAEPRLRDGEAAAFLAEYVGHRHAAVLVDYLAMPAAADVAHHRHGANQVESGSVGGNDYLAGAAMGLRVGIR